MTPRGVAAIRAEGAEVEEVAGTYDEAVAGARRPTGALLVQDTGWPGYDQVPAWIVEGYGTICVEIDAEPGRVAVQIGVGSFAAAMVRRFAGARDHRRRARRRGVRARLGGGRRAGRGAGAARLGAWWGPTAAALSITAWPAVSRGVEAFAAVSDDRAGDAVRSPGAGRRDRRARAARRGSQACSPSATSSRSRPPTPCWW